MEQFEKAVIADLNWHNLEDKAVIADITRVANGENTQRFVECDNSEIVNNFCKVAQSLYDYLEKTRGIGHIKTLDDFAWTAKFGFRTMQIAAQITAENLLEKMSSK
jgi:hypothetical protein